VSTSINAGEQSTAEIRTHICDFAGDLRSGVTIVAATAQHIPPPNEVPKTPAVISFGSIVYVTLAHVETLGMHQLKVLAILSDGDISEMRLTLVVRY